MRGLPHQIIIPLTVGALSLLHYYPFWPFTTPNPDSLSTKIKLGTKAHPMLEATDSNFTTPNPDSLSTKVKLETKAHPILEATHSNATELTTVSCLRKCPHYNNIMMLFYHDGQSAGLNDRLAILDAFASIAGYFCARVWAPRPCFNLSPEHNNHEMVSCDLGWSDFVEIRLNHQHELMVVDMDDPIISTVSPRMPKLMEYHIESLRSQDLLLATRIKDANLTYNHLQQIYNFTEHQLEEDSFLTGKFVWGFNPGFYDVVKDIRGFFHDKKKQHPNSSDFPVFQKSDPAGRCSYLNKTVPPHTEWIKTSIVHSIRKRYPADAYGVFHVRRGDAVNQCNTSLARMASYLSCSFVGTQHVSIALLFLSDERDECYRAAIQNIVEGLGHILFVDLDKEVRAAVDSLVESQPGMAKLQNNYHTFNIINKIRYSGMMDFGLEQRRYFSCYDCANLSQREIFSGGNFLEEKYATISLDVSSLLGGYDRCRNDTF